MAKVINWTSRDLAPLRKAVADAVAAGRTSFMFIPYTEMEAIELDTRYASYLLEYLCQKLDS